MLNNLTRLLQISGGVVLIVIIGVVWYNISSTINELKSTITIKETEINRLVGELDKTKLQLGIERQNVNALSNDIEKGNIEAKALEDKLINKSKELEEWKNKPAEIKYVTKYVKDIIEDKRFDSKECQDGIELNKAISKIEYKDL